MSRDALYPEESSSYTWKGTMYDVPCTMGGGAAAVGKVDCPSGYVPPRNGSDNPRCRKVLYFRHTIVFSDTSIYVCSLPATIALTAVSRHYVYDGRVQCYVGALYYNVMWGGMFTWLLHGNPSIACRYR
jgi:hypothetical protein